MLRIPHCLDNRLTDGGEAESLKLRPPLYTPETFLCFWYSVLLEAEQAPGHKCGSRTRNLPACSVVP
jgi:hypothetical protein